MSRLAPARLLVLTTAAVLAGGAAASASASASSEPSAPENRVEAILAEFDAVATDAGFVSDGEHQEIDDPLGLTEEDDDTSMDDCLPDSDGVIADDGTFVGQLAGAGSGEYVFTDGEPLDTDAGSWFEEETIGVVVAIVDEDATPNVLAVVQDLASDEFADCLQTAAEEWQAGRDSEREGDEGDDDEVDAPITATVSAEALDVGDAAALFGVSQTGEDDDGEELTVAVYLGTAMVGDTFIAVAYTSFDGDDNSDVVVPALEAAVAAAF